MRKVSYQNIDFKLSNFKNNWTTSFKTSIGKNAFKVDNGGFTIYNLGEEYKYTFGIDVSYRLNKNESIKFAYAYSEFEETGNASSNVFMVSYSKAF